MMELWAYPILPQENIEGLCRAVLTKDTQLAKTWNESEHWQHIAALVDAAGDYSFFFCLFYVHYFV